ncbi:MAG: AarF/ABC1/UbiB kinase family protein [Bacteroidia bacterium]|nr:AarF/ABC1/UbiB kinase family protein [Bacteroidia bacterium]
MKFKNLRRYRQVIRVLMKYGFDDVLAHSRFRRFIPHRQLQGELSKYSYTRYERVRMAIEELGPTFIKFGQILSNRPDLLPIELINELEKLQDAVPSFATQNVKTIIETDLGAPVEELFASFSEQPIASASIAQVHEARLKTGEHVVIKVQRPDIASVIDTDLEILAELAEIAEHNFSNLARLEPVEIVKALNKSMNRELNFLLETNNIIRFQEIFKDEPLVYTPVVYTRFSTRRVITMEYVSGTKINQVQKLRDSGVNLHELAKKGLFLYFEQIFKHGFFHADPHPGNVLIMPDGKICLIDFGMMGTLNRQDKDAFKDLIVAITKGNFSKLVNAIERLTKHKKVANKEELEYDINILLDEFPPYTIDERNMTEVVDRLQYIIYKHKLSFPNDFFLLLRTLVILDGISNILDPEFNTLKYIRHQSLRLFEESIRPKNLMMLTLNSLLDIWDYLRVMPSDFKKIIERIKEGKIQIEITGLKPVLHTLDIISNRLAAAIILAAMIIGSSLIVLSHIPPYWNNIPIIGLIGIIFSGVFGVILILSIFRKGKY